MRRDMWYFRRKVIGRSTRVRVCFRSTLPRRSIAVVALLWVCLTACRHQNLSREELKPVLDDFVFAGTLRDLRKWPVEYKDLASELPVNFHPGTYYVFYHHMPNDSVELGYKVLPARLSAAGFQVVKAPKSPLDFEQPEPGQARFLIIFEKSGHRGRIFNRYDRNLGEVESHWKTWGSEAYVVVIDQ